MKRMFSVALTDHTVKSPDVERRVLGTMARLSVSDKLLESEEDMIAFMKDADAIISSSGLPLNGRVMDKIPKLKIISLSSVGFDAVDIAAATERGIPVTNTPDYCSEEVADHAMSMILAQLRGLFIMDRQLRSGKWHHEMGRMTVDERHKPLITVRRSSSQVLGLVAFGRIARRVAVRAKAFGFKVIAYDPYVPRWDFRLLGVERVETLGEVFRRSDFVSAHLPINEETRHLIGAREFGQMKKTAHFVNTGRGGTVDQGALIRALKEKRIAGGALDVFDDEPVKMNSPLLEFEDMILTPHIAAYSEEAMIAAREDSARAVADVLSGRRPQFVLNPEVYK